MSQKFYPESWEFVLREVKEFDEFKKVFGKGALQFIENKPYSEKALRNWQKWLSHVTDDNGCLLPGSEDLNMAWGHASRLVNAISHAFSSTPYTACPFSRSRN